MLKIIINDVEFEEISNHIFVVHGEKDLFPFLNSDFQDRGLFKIRRYKSIIINEKFFAPKIN